MGVLAIEIGTRAGDGIDAGITVVIAAAREGGSAADNVTSARVSVCSNKDGTMRLGDKERRAGREGRSADNGTSGAAPVCSNTDGTGRAGDEEGRAGPKLASSANIGSIERVSEGPSSTAFADAGLTAWTGSSVKFHDRPLTSSLSVMEIRPAVSGEPSLS